MRKIIFIILLLLPAVTLFSQTQTTALSKEDYLKKSKNQKKTANILLIGGGAFFVTGIVFPRGEEERDEYAFISWVTYKNDGLKGVLILAGLIPMLTGIPYYLSAGKNKRRANAITLNLQNNNILIAGGRNLIFKRQPSVSFKLPL